MNRAVACHFDKPPAASSSKLSPMESIKQQSSHSLASRSLILLLFTGLFCKTESVHINSISAPQSYRNGQAHSVVLDCDLSVDDMDQMLIVKWFHDDDKQHIYQWIKDRDERIYSEKIKPYVDESFVVSDHPTRHRAIRLLNPPPSLSGKYTCSVNSIQNDEMNSTYLTIYEPAKSFEIEAVEAASETYHENDDSFNITCTASGVYPEPEIKLYKVQSINDSLEAIEVQSSSTSVLSFRSMADGFYWINLSSHIEQNKTEEQTPARARLAVKRKRNIAEHYECRLSIPNSNYAEVKRLAIQDGWRTKARMNGSQQLNALYTTILLMSLLQVWRFWM